MWLESVCALLRANQSYECNTHHPKHSYFSLRVIHFPQKSVKRISNQYFIAENKWLYQCYFMCWCQHVVPKRETQYKPYNLLMGVRLIQSHSDHDAFTPCVNMRLSSCGVHFWWISARSIYDVVLCTVVENLHHRASVTTLHRLSKV